MGRLKRLELERENGEQEKVNLDVQTMVKLGDGKTVVHVLPKKKKEINMENDIDNRIKKQKRNNNGENALNMDGRQPLVNRNSDIVRNNNVSNGNSSSKRLSHFSAVGIDKKKKTEKDGNKRISGGSENFFATLFASSSSSNSKKQTKGKRKSSLASISIGNIETENIATPVGEINTENSDDDYENG